MSYNPNLIPNGSNPQQVIDRLNQELMVISKSFGGTDAVVRNVTISGGGGGSSVGSTTAFGTYTVVSAAGIVTVSFSPALPNSNFVVAPLLYANGLLSSAVWLPNNNTVSSFQVDCPESGLLFALVALRI